MTESEIIKVLENELECVKRQCGNFCDNKRDCKHCDLVMEDEEIIKAYESIIDLINRQKAEIERLKNENKSIRYCYEQTKSYNDKLAESCETNCKKFNMTTRAEAIKEFAERLKSKIWHHPECNYISSITPDYIDNLVKEMTELETNQRKEDEGK